MNTNAAAAGGLIASLIVDYAVWLLHSTANPEMPLVLSWGDTEFVLIDIVPIAICCVAMLHFLDVMRSRRSS